MMTNVRHRRTKSSLKEQSKEKNCTNTTSHPLQVINCSSSCQSDCNNVVKRIFDRVSNWRESNSMSRSIIYPAEFENCNADGTRTIELQLFTLTNEGNNAVGSTGTSNGCIHHVDSVYDSITSIQIKYGIQDAMELKRINRLYNEDLLFLRDSIWIPNDLMMMKRKAQ